MSRKTKRKLERDVRELKASGPSDIEVSSSVVTITNDMTDSRGNLIEGRVPSSEPPEGYTREELDVQSGVVDVYSLVSIDE